MQPYPDYEIDIGYSLLARQCWCALVLLIAILCLGIFLLSEVPLWIAASAALSIFILCLLIGLSQEPKPSRLSVNEIGITQLVVDDTINGEFTVRCIVLPLCCVIYLQVKNQRASYRFLVWQDTVDEQSYRRLCRIIRLKRRQI